LPWVANHFIGESSIYAPKVKTGIAKLVYSQFDYPEEQIEANAALIVKAVNNHYELLKRLKFAAEWLRALGAF
jgi:hypothetical protein